MQKRLRFTKRTLALALVLVMAVGILPMAGAASDYGDHWSKEYIDDAIGRGWMKGYEDGSFKPESSITRAEFAVMLWRAYGEPAAGGANPFTDVPNGEWYDDATAALYELGITSGVGGGQYDPNGTLTREMGMTMLARAFGIEAEDAESYKGFSDAAQISDWAAAAVSALVEKGYAQGLGENRFAPQNPLKRGEMARILTVVFDGEGGVPETEGGDESITITLSHSPKINTSGNVTVTVTAESENGSITYIGMRKSSVGAKYTDKSGFTDITAASRFTVSDNGWYAVCAEDEQGAFAYKLINITNISRSSGGITTYTVTFDADGGTPVPEAQSVAVDGYATEPVPEPTRPGYEFIGWYYGDVEWDFENYKVESDMTLKAKWTKEAGTGTGVYEKAGEYKAWINWDFDVTSTVGTIIIYVEVNQEIAYRVGDDVTIGGVPAEKDNSGYYFITMQIPKDATYNGMKGTDAANLAAQVAYLAGLTVDLDLSAGLNVVDGAKTAIYTWDFGGGARTYAYIYLDSAALDAESDYKVSINGTELSLIRGRHVNTEDLGLSDGEEVTVKVQETKNRVVTGVQNFTITVVEK